METTKLTVDQITDLQEIYDLTELQESINSGQAWLREGFYGRTAMSALEDGACMLPEEENTDYSGNYIPDRNNLKEGSTGTLSNSQNFWQKVLDGEIDLEYLNEEDDTQEDDD